MAKPITVIKSIGPKLVPFFKTVALYFVLYPHENTSTVFCCLFKCLPIISLMLFVLLQGMSFSIYYRYSRRIFVGLLFSVLGDAFLVWKHNYFLHGTAMFAVAQLMYARAFGFKPFNPYALGVLSVIGTVVYYYLASGLEGLMLYLVALYILLILTMTWRSIARVQFFDDVWTWTKLCGCAGSILFLISDFALAIDKFRTPIPFAHTIVMSTYYAAQLGIALSVVDSQAEELLIQSKQN